MNAMVKKEFRENFKFAVLAIIILGFMLLQHGNNHRAVLRALAPQSSYGGGENAQPLLAYTFLSQHLIFCAIFGAVLGWMQIFKEHHRDLRAFLIHRPVTPTRIFLGKVTAGLVLYIFAAGLPLACFILWVWLPGHVAAPFEWTMALPVLANFLIGIVFYFGGMLTGLRQARWHGTRTFGIGLAVMAALAVSVIPEFWQSMIVASLSGTLLGIAAWGSFESNGYAEGQPALARRSLALVLCIGSAGLLMLGVALLSRIFTQDHDFEWSYYVSSRGGVIYKISQKIGGSTEIVDLEGKRLLDPKTGRMMDQTEFNRRFASPAYRMRVDFERPISRAGYRESSRFFLPWHGNRDFAWYFWRRQARLAGYDLHSRRPAGSLGPEGFAPGLVGERFMQPVNYSPWSPPRTVNTATTVFRVDFEDRTIKPLFSSSEEEPVGGMIDVTIRDSDWASTLIATRHSICLVTNDGGLLWKVPYEPEYPDYASISLSILEPAGRFAVWIAPSPRLEEKRVTRLPQRVLWISDGGEIAKIADLPHLARPDMNPSYWFGLVVPPVAPIVMGIILIKGSWTGTPELKILLLSMVSAVFICLPAWWMGRRYDFSLRALLGWTVFLLLTGVPGLMAFLTVHEWPARVSCPRCAKPRLVTRERCEQCDGSFGASARTGTEIFETVGSTAQAV